MPLLQPAAARRHAVPIVEPRAGTPLIKSTVKTGWMLDRRQARAVVPREMPLERRKGELKKMADQFIKDEYRIDRSVFRGNFKIEGPFPHFDPHEADIQKGSQGGTRPIARSLAKDTTDSEFEDYLLSATFICPEYINEIPTSLAMDLFTQPGGRPGLSPLRAKEWRGIARSK